MRSSALILTRTIWLATGCLAGLGFTFITPIYQRLATLSNLLDAYGLDGPERDMFQAEIVEKFYYQPRPDTVGFEDSHR